MSYGTFNYLPMKHAQTSAVFEFGSFDVEAGTLITRPSLAVGPDGQIIVHFWPFATIEKSLRLY